MKQKQKQVLLNLIKVKKIYKQQQTGLVLKDKKV